MYRRLTAASALLLTLAAAGCSRSTAEAAGLPSAPLPPYQKPARGGPAASQQLDHAAPQVALSIPVK